jgi:hypothetical protein
MVEHNSLPSTSASLDSLAKNNLTANSLLDSVNVRFLSTHFTTHPSKTLSIDFQLRPFTAKSMQVDRFTGTMYFYPDTNIVLFSDLRFEAYPLGDSTARVVVPDR